MAPGSDRGRDYKTHPTARQRAKPVLVIRQTGSVVGSLNRYRHWV